MRVGAVEAHRLIAYAEGFGDDHGIRRLKALTVFRKSCVEVDGTILVGNQHGARSIRRLRAKAAATVRNRHTYAAAILRAGLLIVRVALGLIIGLPEGVFHDLRQGYML
ncbi:hypothetical protein SDC9_118604 [bioreactor metagenome]|uniref:Uncharacterized protein n=1 Tax=bioreactor metagenome TaxID=1076179 RepID=A0A645C1F3_9ZZZZ